MDFKDTKKIINFIMTTQKVEKGKTLTGGLTSSDIVKLMYALEGERLSFDKLYYYEKTSLIIPSIKKAKGKGVPRLYSVEDFILLRWLVQMNKCGIHLNRFRSVIEFVKTKMPEIIRDPQNWVLVTDGNSVKFLDKISKKTLDIIEDSAQYLLVFPVGRMTLESEIYINKYK